MSDPALPERGDPEPCDQVGREDVLKQVPVRWVDVLQERAGEYHSFIELALDVLKREVSNYRDRLLDIEDCVRRSIANEDLAGLRGNLHDLVALNEEWMVHQYEAIAALAEQRVNAGAYGSINNRVENLLLDQTTIIESHCLIVQRIDLTGDEVAGQKIVHEIGHLVRMAHELRDALRESMATIIVNEKRLDEVDPTQAFDAQSDMQDRLGIEFAFHTWWRDDAERLRALSVALLDVDRFGGVVVKAGTRAGDKILAALGRYLEQLALSDSGLARVYRFSGQQYLVFLADTGPRTAGSNVDRMRQAVEATTFQSQAGNYTLTLRAGIVEVGPDEDTQAVFTRLSNLVDAAKRAGRNRTCVDEGKGASIVRPEPYDIKARVISVE